MLVSFFQPGAREPSGVSLWLAVGEGPSATNVVNTSVGQLGMLGWL